MFILFHNRHFFKHRFVFWFPLGYTLCTVCVFYSLRCSSLLYPLAVQIVHRFGDGVEYSACFSLWEELLPENLIQQLSSFHKLRNQVYKSPLIIHLSHTNTHAHEQISHIYRQNRTAKVWGWDELRLTSFSVIMFGCWPYRIRISISSEGSRLLLSIIYNKQEKEAKRD